MGSNLTQGMDVWCAFFCVCVQVEALRRADHSPKESYLMSNDLVRRSETESFMEVGLGPNEGRSAKGKNSVSDDQFI
jgi:hypothetical protein